MSSILSSQAVVLATAMAVSGTVLLLAFCRQKTQFPIAPIDQSPQRAPRPCISSGAKKRERKKKRVHFAEDVVDPIGNSEEFRRQHNMKSNSEKSLSSLKLKKNGSGSGNAKVRGMPENRVALYNGILRDRVVHRMACAY